MHSFLHTPPDPALLKLMRCEARRQKNTLSLIASENIAPRSVLKAQGSILTNKYAEGLPGKRYYGGCAYVDSIERLAIERAKTLYQCAFANVQPHSGSQANQAVFLALANPYDAIVSLSLSSGGHLSHGSHVNFSGKWLTPHTYALDPETYAIDYNAVERLCLQHKPKILIAGASSYPRLIDLKRFRSIADDVGAYLMVDMAHFSGLIAGKAMASPFPHAHIVTTTTHKTLQGPRGGMILCNDPSLAKKIDHAVFPGLQGGPLMNNISAKAVCFLRAMEPFFSTYAKQMIHNAQSLGKAFVERGFGVVTGGTDCHFILLDVYKKGLTGKRAEETLEKISISCNKNVLPFDKLPPSSSSGLRLGTPCGTTRGLSQGDFFDVGHIIADVLEEEARQPLTQSKQRFFQKKIQAICERFPYK